MCKLEAGDSVRVRQHSNKIRVTDNVRPAEVNSQSKKARLFCYQCNLHALGHDRITLHVTLWPFITAYMFNVESIQKMPSDQNVPRQV